MIRKITALILSISLIITQPVFAQGVAELNIGKYLSQMPVLNTDSFRPPRLRYISYDIKSNDFKLLLDQGDTKLSNPPNSSTPKLQDATRELFNYFLIGLSLPNEKFWVNLRPDAPEQIIDPLLEKTDMGKIMLEADLELKKDTSSLTSPQNPEGKEYWDKLYKKAGELFGTENITIPTITRPWIVPGEVMIRGSEDSAYIYKANLKVMLEEDYISHQSSAFSHQQYTFSDSRMKELNKYSTELIKELILPRLTQEINTSKKYAQLRQVFFSLILSRWFKDKFKGQPGQYSGLIDSRNLDKLNSKESWNKEYYFNEYKKSFQQGEYNLKEQITTPTGQVIRSYVSGGIKPVIEEVDSFKAGSPILGKLLVVGIIVLEIGAGIIITTMIKEFLKNVEVTQAKKLELENINNRIKIHSDVKPVTFIAIVEKIIFDVSRDDSEQKLLLRLFYDFAYGTEKDKSIQRLEDMFKWVGTTEINKETKERMMGKIAELKTGMRPTLQKSLKDISNAIDTFSYSFASMNIERREGLVGLLNKQSLNGIKGALEDNPDVAALLDWIEEALFNIRHVRHRKMGYGPEGAPDKFLNDFRELFDPLENILVKKQLEIYNKLSDYVTGSSPLAPQIIQAQDAELETGGIDFTRINYLTRPMGSFQGLDLRLPLLSKAELEGIDINKELASVEKMVNAKIDVSTDRLKRLLAAMSQKDAFTSQRETQLLPLLLRLCWLKEEKGAETTPDFRAVLLIADTGLFVEQGNTKYSLN